MNASEDDLHTVIDSFMIELNTHDGTSTYAACDPGRGTADEPVTALERALVISHVYHDAECEWKASLRDRRVLIAGEFPPHLIEELLAEQICITQIHSPHEGGFPPPHFYHLSPYGLCGITNLHDLANIQCDVVLVHGTIKGLDVRVSSLVPIVLRMFPEAEKHLLEGDHIAPHMLMRVPHQGFKCIAITL